jgi:hypothetical protein
MVGIVIEWKPANPPGKQGGTKLKIMVGGTTKHEKDYGPNELDDARQDAIRFLEGNQPDNPPPDPAATVNV